MDQLIWGGVCTEGSTEVEPTISRNWVPWFLSWSEKDSTTLSEKRCSLSHSHCSWRLGTVNSYQRFALRWLCRLQQEADVWFLGIIEWALNGQNFAPYGSDENYKDRVQWSSSPKTLTTVSHTHTDMTWVLRFPVMSSKHSHTTNRHRRMR